MAYLSDIDLATLHKKRLDEKNHYKLSWYNRRFYDDDIDCEQHISVKPEEHKVKSKVGSSAKPTKAKSNASQMNTKTSCEQSARASNDGNNDIPQSAVANKGVGCNRILNSNSIKGNDFYDEGYFSSPTPNRRRSGTWP